MIYGSAISVYCGILGSNKLYLNTNFFYCKRKKIFIRPRATNSEKCVSDTNQKNSIPVHLC